MKGKHRIIASETSNIISERSGEASSAAIGGDIISLRPVEKFTLFEYNEMKRDRQIGISFADVSQNRK